MNSSQYKINQLKHLCAILGCKQSELDYIVQNLDEFYREWTEKKKDKVTGDYKKYKDGTIKKRIIRPSKKRLKEIQSTIKKKILALIPLPDNIHGGVKGRTNITNAKVHQGNKYKFTLDLMSFFPNISSQQVYDSFINLKFSTHQAHMLTKLTTWKHELPQGTPTSTHLANLVFLNTDFAIIDLCKKHRLTYTRYVDDITISSQEDFKPLLQDFIEIVTNNDFKVNFRKTKYEGIQTITGIDVYNNYIDAPLKIKIKAEEEKVLQTANLPINNYIERIRSTNTNIKKK